MSLEVVLRRLEHKPVHSAEDLELYYLLRAAIDAQYGLQGVPEGLVPQLVTGNDEPPHVTYETVERARMRMLYVLPVLHPRFVRRGKTHTEPVVPVPMDALPRLGHEIYHTLQAATTSTQRDADRARQTQPLLTYDYVGTVFGPSVTDALLHRVLSESSHTASPDDLPPLSLADRLLQSAHEPTRSPVRLFVPVTRRTGDVVLLFLPYYTAYQLSAERLRAALGHTQAL